MARSQAVRSHVRNQPDVPRLIFRRKRPPFPFMSWWRLTPLTCMGFPFRTKPFPGSTETSGGPEAALFRPSWPSAVLMEVFTW